MLDPDPQPDRQEEKTGLQGEGDIEIGVIDMEEQDPE